MRRLVQLLEHRLPVPPATLRRGPFQDGAFTSEARSERTTSLLGLALAVAFGTCFLTGLVSHLIQQPPAWFDWPTRPVGLYRVTQGAHVATGLASIPLLLAKLWSVYPKLFTWPPARDVAEALSRLGLLVLVGSAIFQLLSGLVNVARWYAVMPFFFTVAHYWTAWIAIGALVVHVGSKLHIVARSLRHQQPAEATTSRDVLHRRQFLASAGAAAVVVTVATLGQTVPGLRRLSVLAPRDPQFGPAGLPVNKTARSAGVLASARAADYALAVDGPNPLRLSRAELEQLPQHTVELPITCVEGWSATGVWTGVRLRDVLSRSGVDVAGSDAVVRVESLQTGGRYRSSEVSARLAADPLTLLALSLNGQPLDLDHGYPLRLIAPNRPGVLQTKWVGRISVNRPGQP